MPNIGVPPHIPGIRGLSWFAVEQMSKSPLGLAQSHAHPDPNLVPAAAENLDLNSSK